MYFREISTIQDIYKDEGHAGTNLFNRGTTRLLLSSNAAGINNGKKVTPQGLAWIQVCSARDYPNAIPQSILICVLCL